MMVDIDQLAYPGEIHQFLAGPAKLSHVQNETDVEEAIGNGMHHPLGHGKKGIKIGKRVTKIQGDLLAPLTEIVPQRQQRADRVAVGTFMAGDQEGITCSNCRYHLTDHCHLPWFLYPSEVTRCGSHTRSIHHTGRRCRGYSAS